LHEQLVEQAQLEMAQMAEQETARQLISEASQKLSEAVQGKANNPQGTILLRLLSVGSEKLTACTKQLADIKHEKEKIEEKLKKLEQRVVRTKATETPTLSHAHKAFLKCFREWTPMPM